MTVMMVMIDSQIWEGGIEECRRLRINCDRLSKEGLECQELRRMEVH
jgi:hypothetical protein